MDVLGTIWRTTPSIEGAMPMSHAVDSKIRTVEAKCRIVAADLESRGMRSQHDAMVSVADSLRGRVRTAQWSVDPMIGNPDVGMGLSELADLGTPENPRPTEDEILARRPAPGSKTDPGRARGDQAVESSVRKWSVTFKDIPAADERELRGIVDPIVAELGCLLSDYKEEPLRTRGR